MADSGNRPSRQKRPYVTPKLERLGTIRDLTQGLGTTNEVDGGHPPGHNKSRVTSAPKK